MSETNVILLKLGACCSRSELVQFLTQTLDAYPVPDTHSDVKGRASSALQDLLKAARDEDARTGLANGSEGFKMAWGIAVDPDKLK